MKKKLESMTAVILSGVLSFLFLFASPLHPWNSYDVGTDSGVFKTVSMMMERGYMPYRDTFDHKGPLLYLINWLGDRFSSYRGVWLIEFVFMTVTVFMLYKIARLSCRRWEAAVTAMVSLTLLYSYFEGGNLVEEYAVCFISISLFIFVDYLKNNKVTRLRLIICGAALAGTLLLRPNMIVVWAVMCLTILIKTVLKKDWKSLGFFILYFCTGILIIMAPILLWLAIKGIFPYFWDAYVVFNFEYSSDATFADIWGSLFTFFSDPIFYVAFIAQVYSMKSENKWLSISYMLCIVATFATICFTGTPYKHYGMILIPLLAYPISYIFEQIGRLKVENVGKVLSMLVCLYMMVTLVIPDWEYSVQVLAGRYKDRNNGKISMTTGTVVNYVEDYTTDDDCISVYGNWDLIYVLSKRRHATRYSYQFPISEVRTEIMDEYLTQLAEEKPKVIVVQDDHNDDIIQKFLNDNCYELVWAENEKKVSGALVYAKE